MNIATFDFDVQQIRDEYIKRALRFA